MYTHVDDTIVAISSAAGHGLRGIVRLSGPKALEIADGFFVAKAASRLESLPPFAAHAGRVTLEGDVTLPATVLLFRAPHSYTRQDIVELHLTGSPPVLEMLVQCCITQGARAAEPGEFTARAFLAGAVSLAAAEGVAATIHARSDAQLRAARRMLRGELTERVAAWQNELADLLALVVADIDFAEEPIEFISPQQLRTSLARIQESLEGLLAAAHQHSVLDVLPRILLLGPPNAGKSTLLNALSGMDRAITSAVAGTTRDVLEAPVRCGRLDAVLLDAAGIDEDPDEVLAAGRARALDAAARVELVALVADATRPIDAAALRDLALRSGAATVLVLTKADLCTPGQVAAALSAAPAGLGPCVAVSAATGAGLEALRDLFGERLGAAPSVEAGGLLLSARQRAALVQAADALARAEELAAGAAATIDCAELIALELQEALDALAALTGAVTTEDLLGRIFANFCIGK